MSTAPQLVTVVLILTMMMMMGGVGEMEKREQFGEDGVDAGASPMIYQRELAELPAAAQLPRPRSTGDRSVMHLVTGVTGRDIFEFVGMCRAL